MKIIQQGDAYPTGGRFVGVAPNGVIWIYYGDDAEDFRKMVLAFSIAYLKQTKAMKVSP